MAVEKQVHRDSVFPVNPMHHRNTGDNRLGSIVDAPQQQHHASSNNSQQSYKSNKSSRPGSADSRPGSKADRTSWLSLSNCTKVGTQHSIDKSIKHIDAALGKDTSFIQQLEQKIIDREVSRRQASELLNKRWNDSVYIPIMDSIHEAMDSSCEQFSDQLQEQYAHYLNHNNQSDGAVFLDVFNEQGIAQCVGDYQPLRLKAIQANMIKPKKVNILDDPLKPEQSKLRQGKTGEPQNVSFWDKMVEGSYNIESPDRERSRRRIKIEDINRKSQINWSEWYRTNK